MKTENRSFTFKGKQYSGVIVWPSNLAEALQLLGEADMWEAFKLGYLEHCRRQICGITRRRKTRKIDVSDLPEHDQQAILFAVEQMRELYRQPQPVQKSVPLESQSTDQIDFDGTQEEAQVSTSVHADSFEADFAKYLASLDSSPQQHTETP